MTKTIEKSTDLELTLYIVSWEQYFNALIRERSYYTVEEYNVQKSYSSPGGFDEDTGENIEGSSSDAIYERSVAVVGELENPSEDIKKQFLEQLKGVEEKTLSEDFQDSIEIAALQAMENFVDIESCVIVSMGEGHYILAPTTRDDLLIKLLNFTQGALIIYRPQMFTKFKI